jgi:hypothetical protein
LSLHHGLAWCWRGDADGAQHGRGALVPAVAERFVVPLPRSMSTTPYGFENCQRFGGGEIEARGFYFFLDGAMEQRRAGEENMSLHAIVGLGGLYQNDAGEDWRDDQLRFGLFCRAAAKVALGEIGLGRRLNLAHA